MVFTAKRVLLEYLFDKCLLSTYWVSNIKQRVGYKVKENIHKHNFYDLKKISDWYTFK